MPGPDIGGVLGDIGGGIGNFSVLLGAAGKNRESQRWKELIAIINALEPSSFDMSQLDAPELFSQGEISPESYDPVSFDLERAGSTDDLRGHQLEALEGIEGFAENGLDLDSRLAAEQAQRAIGTQQGRYTQNLLRSLQERGEFGGGSELAARLSGGQQSANLSRDMGVDLARDAVNRRYRAMTDAGSLSGDIRSSDFGEAQSRAEMANRFNAFLAGQGTDAARYAADERAGAQERNLGRREDVADTNTRARYDAQVRNQEYLNRVRDTAFGQRFDKTKLLSGAYGGLADADWRRYMERAERIAQTGYQAGKGTGGAVSAGLGIV